MNTALRVDSAQTDGAPEAPEAPETAEAAAAEGANPSAQSRLLRIQEVAAEVGTTTRAIRYYEEIGLLQPAARSEGDYRLYDQSDLERIRHIRELRDGAGISLAEIGQLLDDEDVRAANRAAFQATDDPLARARILTDSIERVERAIELLSTKADRLNEMIRDAEGRRQRLRDKLADLEPRR
jgi:DNA-binding transcriptional MerR regulator